MSPCCMAGMLKTKHEDVKCYPIWWERKSTSFCNATVGRYFGSELRI